MTLHPLPRMDDHELLAASLDDLMAENRLAASRQRALLEFFRRRIRHRRSDGDDDRSALTARQEVEIEVSELWSVPASWVRRQLNDAIWVDEHFPYLAELAGEGRIDPYRVKLIAETARNSLDTAEEWAALVRHVEPFLAKHLRSDASSPAPTSSCATDCPTCSSWCSRPRPRLASAMPTSTATWW